MNKVVYDIRLHAHAVITHVHFYEDGERSVCYTFNGLEAPHTVMSLSNDWNALRAFCEKRVTESHREQFDFPYPAFAHLTIEQALDGKPCVTMFRAGLADGAGVCNYASVYTNSALPETLREQMLNNVLTLVKNNEGVKLVTALVGLRKAYGIRKDAE